MDELLKFFLLTKVDEASHTVYGVAASEMIDSDNEIADYAATKSAFSSWSEEALAKTTTAGQDPSLGNIRIQHNAGEIGGKATKLDFKDDNKQTWLQSTPVNDEVWKMLKGGFLTGYSQAGSYLWRKCDTCGNELPRQVRKNYCSKCGKDVVVRYAPTISEVSYVDRGANPDATFAYVRSDGSIEMRKFAKKEFTEADAERIAQELRAHLDSVLGTELEKFQRQIAALGEHSATGDTMKPEDIKKCAAALGISEADFVKTYVEGDALQKGMKGLAALHAHLKKAMAHHSKMEQHHAKIMEMHKAHSEMHGQMADHMENCMKAHGACMDGAEAEKVLKSLIPESSNRSTVEGSEDLKKLSEQVAALQKKLDETPAPPKAQLFPVPRISEEEQTRITKSRTEDEVMQPVAI